MGRNPKVGGALWIQKQQELHKENINTITSKATARSQKILRNHNS